MQRAQFETVEPQQLAVAQTRADAVGARAFAHHRHATAARAQFEGLAVTAGGNVYIVNDNDGVEDNSGETELLNLGAILD
jgi:hypothetical protein